MKPNPVKRALREGKPQVGTWLSLGSVVAARFLARTGLPWLTVDMEHTHTDIQTAAMMFGAIADAGCVPLARVPAGRHDHIKSVLDCGAMGIVAPMVMDADEARDDRRGDASIPRSGNRSVGGGLHAMNFGATAEEYYRQADDEILVVIQTEHIEAVEIADEIYAVPGHRRHLRRPERPRRLAPRARRHPAEHEADGGDRSTRIREAAARQGVPCGLHVTTDRATPSGGSTRAGSSSPSAAS